MTDQTSSKTAPTAFVEALSSAGAVPFIGLATARGGTNALTASIGAAALAIEPRSAQEIIALADTTRFVQRLLGTAATVALPSKIILWLHNRARTTIPDVFVRSALEEAEEAGQLIFADMSEITHAFDAAGISVHDLATTVGSIVVDVEADTARWLLDDNGYVVESAPLPLSAIRHIAAAGADLGLIDATGSAGPIALHIVQQFVQPPEVFTDLGRAERRMATIVAEHELPVGAGGEIISEANTRHSEQDTRNGGAVRIYSIPLAAADGDEAL